jgi:pyruvate/2-oxoglutarate dehydrogenase complex dihydrolipoamide acyltransferase (E2) component
VRDPEVINQWLAQMKKAVRYTWKQVPEGAVPPSFDSLEEARQYLLAQSRDQVVRPVEHVRFPGKILETLPAGEIRRATEGSLERQRRFPLETANALRGRLRREGFSIFKKGSKGISYVCAVRRKFRAPGQVFSDSIGALITFITEHPMIRRSELPGKFLGLKLPAAPTPAEPAPPPATPAGETAAAAPPTPPTAAPAPHLSPGDHERFAKMHGDLRWLVSEGYVMEFMDGRLFAPPPMAEARKQEVEGSENDPENFPEAAPPPARAEAAAPATAAETEVAEAAPPAQESPASGGAGG